MYSRYFSVKTGALSFVKIKDSKRFYRWLLENGFSGCVVVTRPKAPWPRDGKDGWGEANRLRKLLQRGLPERLHDKALKKVVALPEETLPRSLWMRIDAPMKPGAEKPTDRPPVNNSSRYAVRFAFTMLAIASLKELKRSERRRGP